MSSAPLRDRVRPLDLARAMVPRGLAERYAMLRRDLAMLASGFTGQRPSPFVTRTRREPSRVVTDAAAPVIVPRRWRIARIVRETADAVSLHLEDPTGAPIRFEPGQFFTVHVDIDGRTHKRAYSACTSAIEGPGVAIAVKRIPGGLVSTHLVERVREGDLLDVLGPSGSFTPARASGPRTLVLVAGGSGVTPLASIARTILATEPDTRVLLIYGNRRAEDVMFRDALDALARESEGRFVVRHVLEEPPAGWSGEVGRLDRDTATREFDAMAAREFDAAEFFVCGPEAMMREVRAALGARGVDGARIHEERFTQPHLREGAATRRATSPERLTVRARGREHDAVIAPGQTLLEAGVAANAPMPFSCTMGGCAACKVRLVSGDVEMEEPNCLTAEERAAGYVLACVARPCSAVVVEVPS